MSQYKYAMNECIYFDNGLFSGDGIVKGIATISLPVTGVGYIVEVLKFDSKSIDVFPNEQYPYTHIVVYEYDIRNVI